MKGNSKDEDGLRRITSDKGAKKFLPSVMVRRYGNTECQEVKPYFLPKSQQILPHRHPCHFFPGGDSVSSVDGTLKNQPGRDTRSGGEEASGVGNACNLEAGGLRVRASWLPEGVSPENISDLGFFICKMAQ